MCLLPRVWPAQVATKDESVTQVWERVRGPLRQALRTLGISSVPTARRSELAALDQIINRDVPELRWAGGLRVGMKGSHMAFWISAVHICCCRTAATKAGILLGAAENSDSAANAAAM